VAWEQDIRPSDATYLAEQWKVPFYIDSGVWHETAITHSELQESERDNELPFDHPGDKENAADGTVQASNQDSRDPVGLTVSSDASVDSAGIMCGSMFPTFPV
jgi:bifunctional DNase/RNase